MRALDALMAEGWPAIEGLQLAVSLGLTSVVVESDCLNLVNFVLEGFSLLLILDMLFNILLSYLVCLISFLSAIFLKLVIRLPTV